MQGCGTAPSKRGVQPSSLGMASIISGGTHEGSKNLPSGDIMKIFRLPETSAKSFMKGLSSVRVIFRASGYARSTDADSICDRDSSALFTAKMLTSPRRASGGIFR